MRPNMRALIDRCIEEGVKRGYYRAHKHNEDPSMESICSAIEDAVMSEIYEWFIFDDTCG